MSTYFLSMNYPQKQATTLYLTLRRKWRFTRVFSLIIPQGTIWEISEMQDISESDMQVWLLIHFIDWWLPEKYTNYLLKKSPETIAQILEHTFLKNSFKDDFPESVQKLADKEEYDYNASDSVIFTTVSKSFWIAPRELLNYTYDELNYLMNSLRWQNLNDEQKAELQRLEKTKEMKTNKKDIDTKLSLLNNL